ncbi:MAG: 4-hydroxy-tetrahydrodipicolinate synthase [Chitinophagales bacterium]|jgi:4-hydroxy-tetrahydrodipicolinate synthase|nr:4-hydroxy-tetrahydrodipicolinate synthase [Chitinophagales bacterium]
MKALNGLGVALVTPFTKEGKIDFPSLKKIINHCILGNVTSLVVLGTTGEAATLTETEKQDVFDFVAENANDSVTLVAGIGGNNTLQTIDELKKFNLKKYHYILSVCPYYSKPNQEGIYQHYKTIAKASPLPIILYNVPGRTGVNMKAETTLRLAREIDKIVAIKEASGNIEQCMDLVYDKPKDFLVLSGDDSLIVSQMAIGMNGCISVIGNLLPSEFSKMIALCHENKYDEARVTQLKTKRIVDFLFEEGNPVGIKLAMSLKSLCTEFVRLPLVKGSEELKIKLRNELIQLD